MTGRGHKGFTLVELVVSLTLLSVIVGAVVGVTLGMQRGYVRQRETVTAEDALRIAETTIATILRSAGANPRDLSGGSAPRLEPNPLNHATFDNLRVVADFNPADGNMNGDLEDVQLWVANDTLFVRWKAATAGGVAAPVAYPVRSVLFQYYANDGTLLTSVPQVVGATRVKVTLTAPRHNRPTVLTRREIWVYLRNRR